MFAEVSTTPPRDSGRQTVQRAPLEDALAAVEADDRAQRMGAQCVNILTLRDGSFEGEQPSADQLECLAAMAALADHQMAEAARVFAERDEDGAGRLTQEDREINEHTRRRFALAVRDGDSEARREVGFLVAVMARAVERIGDNAVDIARQAAFAAPGRLPE